MSVCLCLGVCSPSQAVPHEKPLPHAAVPSPDAPAPLWHGGVLPETLHRNPLLHLLLLRGLWFYSDESVCVVCIQNWNVNFPDPEDGFLKILKRYTCGYMCAGHKIPVFGSQGPEETVLEVPHQVHDVVPAPRGTEDHHWRVRAGESRP